MGIIGQDRHLCLFFLGPLPAYSKASGCGIGEGREQRTNKGSENKYKETRETIEETDIGNSERNCTSREHVHVFGAIFYSIAVESTGALAILLCIVKVFSFSELFNHYPFLSFCSI